MRRSCIAAVESYKVTFVAQIEKVAMISQLQSRHKDQFEAMGLPKHLYQSACEKIASQSFDAGSYLQFQEVEHSSDDSEIEDEAEPEFEGLSDAVSCKYSLVACSDIKNEGIVLLIDHMW
jgi:hypothetical protein